MLQPAMPLTALTENFSSTGWIAPPPLGRLIVAIWDKEPALV
jgi:hypothetical protein